MKTKLFSLALALLMSVSLFAQSGTCGANLTWTLSDSVLTISGLGDMTSSSQWSSYRAMISYVNIQDGVSTICDYAFRWCINLKHVSIPNSVTHIGRSVFSGCSNIMSITIPNSVISIGMEAFNGCEGLKSIILPNSITQIESFTFCGCSSLATIIIPDSVHTIGGSAFKDCANLSSITLPANIVNVSSTTFQNCNRLPIIESIRYADSYLVEAVDKTLSTYTIKDGTKIIGDYAFMDCNNLISISIPNCVKIINPSVFENCIRLTSVTIPYSVNTMKGWVFRNCPSLISAFVQNPAPINIENLTQDRYVIFSGNSSATSVPTNLTIYVPCGSLEEYKSAPKWDLYQTRITYSPVSNVIYKANDANRGVVEAFVPQFICDSAVLSATSNQGYYFSKWSDNTTLNPYVLYLTQDTTITAIFEKNAYTLQTQVNDSLYGITVGDTTALYLDTITIRAIPESECYFVKWSDGNVDNPRRIVLIQDTVFSAIFERLYNGQCGDSLYWSYNSDTLSFSGSGDMYNYDGALVPWTPHNQTIREISLSPEMTSIGDNAFKGIWGLANVNIPAGVVHIGESSFNGCTGLHHLTIPNSVSSLGSRAFANCSAIDSLIIGTGIKRISDQFYWCSGLKYLVLGQNVEEIEHGAFMDARCLSNIVCHAAEPPTAYPDEASGQRSFYNVHALVLIPCDNFSAYQHDALWGSFDLQCLSTDSGIATDGVVTVVAGDADATFTWPTSSSADSYTLQITKDDEVFCTLTFNAMGQLLGIAFAPARDGSVRQTPQATLTTNGMKFQVTGLDYASHYNFSFDTKNKQEQTIFAYSGWFSTNGATGIEKIAEDSAEPRKIWNNGQLYILLPDGTRYDATGKKVE